MNTERPASPDRIEWVIRTVVPNLVLIAMLGIAVRQAAAALTNDDTFFHLRLGHEFLSGWSISDPGSVTTLATRDWVPTQWAGQMAMSGMDDLFGLAGVAWLAGLMFTAYIVALYVACRHMASPLTAALVTVIAFVCSTTGLSARPQMVSYLLVVVVTLAWLRTAQDRKLRWWLVPLIWVWATIHGMWPIGVAIGVVGVLGCVLDLRPGRTWLIQALSIPAMSAVAVCLTPIGPRLYLEILSVGSRSEYFKEWAAPQFTELAPLLLAALLALTLGIRLRQASLSWVHTLLLLQAGGWAIYSARTIPVAAAMLAPIAAAAIQSVQRPAEPMQRPEKLFVAGAWAASLVVLAVAVPGTSASNASHPPWADDALSDLPSGTVVLNEWDWGGYLMWKHPDLNLVMHGYGDMFTDAELDRNVDITLLKPNWDEQVESTGASVAMLDPQSSLAYALERSRGWTVVRQDDDAVLLAAPRRWS
jgi:hypothetical protein